MGLLRLIAQAATAGLLALPRAAASAASEEPIAGGPQAKEAFRGWLREWRGTYKGAKDLVPELSAEQVAKLPVALRNVEPRVVLSSGGVAGGIVSEGMGYSMMVEAFEAVSGSHEAKEHGLRLARGWVGVALADEGLGGSHGLPVWKFPRSQCKPRPCLGTATDGDEDAVLGLVYLAAALDYPADFVAFAMRMIVAFAVADLGFPDLFRILPDGTRLFVPKGGSEWGALMPETGPHRGIQEPWCYSPSYFAPAHYRLFRDFAAQRWAPGFETYLPAALGGPRTGLQDLLHALDGAVTAGYNLLYRSSCPSGAVANWVGARTPCDDPEAQSCPGVPWATTPYVGLHGNCSASGTPFGAYGADASRTPWRVAMDYFLYSGESKELVMYDRRGHADGSIDFSAKAYLNRIARQYRRRAHCDGGTHPKECFLGHKVKTELLAAAFDPADPSDGLVCAGVPTIGESWWAPFMAYPTFSAFVAPLGGLSRDESRAWIELFASICSFPKHGSGKPVGTLCSSSYFDLAQELVSSMVMAGVVVGLPEGRPASTSGYHGQERVPEPGPGVPVPLPTAPAIVIPAGVPEEAHARSAPWYLAWLPTGLQHALGYSGGDGGGGGAGAAAGAGAAGGGAKDGSLQLTAASPAAQAGIPRLRLSGGGGAAAGSGEEEEGQPSSAEGLVRSLRILIPVACFLAAFYALFTATSRLRSLALAPGDELADGDDTHRSTWALLPSTCPGTCDSCGDVCRAGEAVGAPAGTRRPQKITL